MKAMLGVAVATITLLCGGEIANANFNADVGAARAFSAQSSQAQHVDWRHGRHCGWAHGHRRCHW